jgi:hypothetical protein
MNTCMFLQSLDILFSLTLEMYDICEVSCFNLIITNLESTNPELSIRYFFVVVVKKNCMGIFLCFDS